MQQIGSVGVAPFAHDRGKPAMDVMIVVDAEPQLPHVVQADAPVGAAAHMEKKGKEQGEKEQDQGQQDQQATEGEGWTTVHGVVSELARTAHPV